MAKFAFDYATKHGKKKVKAVHKAMNLGDCLFLKCCQELNEFIPIFVNIAAGLVGGAALVAGEGYSQDRAVFETRACHSYQEVAGKNVINPAGMLLTSDNMLDMQLLVTMLQGSNKLLMSLQKKMWGPGISEDMQEPDSLQLLLFN